MEIQIQPYLIDQLKIQVTSQRLRLLPANDPNASIYGLTKKEATLSALYYADLHQNQITKMARKRGRPTIWFKPTEYRDYKTKSVSLEAYGAFTIWIFANPTETQKKLYIEQGHIDPILDLQEKRHEGNYIHTDNCQLPPDQIETDNMNQLPHTWELAENISKEILGHDPQGYDPNLYTHASIELLELNQDLLTYPHDSTTVQEQLWRFLTSPAGKEYLYNTRVQHITTQTNMEYTGTTIILDYGNKGIIKIYPKTHHALRTEVRLYGKQHIRKTLGTKNLETLQQVIDEIAKPLLQNARIPEILRKQPEPTDHTPLILEHTIDDPQTLNMAKKLHDKKYLLKHEIPPKYRRKGKHHILKGERHGKTWHYTLQPQTNGGIP